jgi:hypothetical protein
MPLWTIADTTSKLWLDGADPSTLYDSINFGLIVSANGPIARWEDKSGSMQHVTQATLTNRPIRKDAIQNGRNVVRFDGSNDILSRGPNSVWQNISWGSIFIVRKVSRTTLLPWLVGIGANAGGNLRAVLDLHRGATTKPGAGGRRIDTDNFANVQSSINYSTTRFELHAAVFDYSAAALTVRINGSVDGNLSPFQTSGLVPNTSSGFIHIGSNPGLTWFDGDIGEIIISHNPTDLFKIEGYLAHKWGIAEYFPTNHPFKLGPPTKGGLPIYCAASSAALGV